MGSFVPGSDAMGRGGSSSGFGGALGSLASTIGGGIFGAIGGILGGQDAAKAAKYNARMEAQNAAVAKVNANIAGEAGAEQAAISSQKTREEAGAVRATRAASGIETNSGSGVDVDASVRELGQLDAMTIRSNAAKEAYGYQVQAANHMAQSNLDKEEASNDLEAGWVKGAGTFLGSVADAGDQYSKFLAAGAL